MDSFCTFLYNSETGQLLGRGGKSWFEIGIFYLIYYTILSGFFAATIAVFYETVDENRPKLQDDSSLLKGNPGLGYKPMPNIESTLVHIAEGNQKGAKNSIDEILNGYDKQKNNIDCTGDKNDGEKACKFDVQILKDFCNENNFYGHGPTNPQPCVLLKLNKIFGWIPKIAKVKPEGLNIANASDPYTPDRIWISCEGENPADRQSLGKVSYSPQQGFPLAFYPYKKQENYKAPLVMVKFENPMKRLGLMVKCTAFAENILVDSSEKQGSVNFELLVDVQ